MITTTFVVLVVILASCQNESTNNSNAGGRYVPWQGTPYDDIPHLLDTENGIVYTVPNKHYMISAVEAFEGRIVPDSSMAHWIPIISFKE